MGITNHVDHLGADPATQRLTLRVMWARVVAVLGQLAPRQMEPVQMAAEMSVVAVPPLPSCLLDFRPRAKRALVFL